MNDGRLVIGVICLSVLILVAVVGIISPRTMWSLTTAWRYSNTDAMEPTPRQYRLRRVHSASLLALFVPPVIGIAWPGEFPAKLFAWAVSSILMIVLVLATTVTIWLVLRHRFAASDSRRPSELSGLGYTVEWLQVIYTFAYVVVVVAVVIGLNASLDQQRQDQLDREAAPLTEEGQEAVDRVEAVIAPRTVRDVPVVTEAPTGSVAGVSGGFELADAGITLVTATRTCAPTGVLLVETDEVVQVALVYPVATMDECPVGRVGPLDVIDVPLEGPLGERPVQRLDGSRVVAYD